MKVASASPKPFDILLIESWCRLSRDWATHTRIMRHLRQAGIEVQTTDASFPDPGVPLLDHLFPVFEDCWRRSVAEDLPNRRLMAARNGFWSTPAPFGYMSVRKADSRYTLAIQEDEAKVVRCAFHLIYDRQVRLSRVAFYLNEGGHRTRAGKIWRVSAIKKMLENPIYMGLARIQAPLNINNIVESITGIGVPAPRIVSRELFFSIQRILRNQSLTSSRACSVKQRMRRSRP